MLLGTESNDSAICYVQERDKLLDKQKEHEYEVDLLKKRLDASQQAWSTTRKELEAKEAHYGTIDRDLNDRLNLSRSADVQLRSFKETLAKLLSDGYAIIEPHEDHIRERVQELVNVIRDKTSVSMPTMKRRTNFSYGMFHL